MTDKELLERAAKVAGVELTDRGDDGLWFDDCDLGHFDEWDPLECDRQSFRLAVYLGFIVDVDNEEHVTTVDFTARFEDITLLEGHGCDPYAATRRAIVRAAAQLA